MTVHSCFAIAGSEIECFAITTETSPHLRNMSIGDGQDWFTADAGGFYIDSHVEMVAAKLTEIRR